MHQTQPVSDPTLHAIILTLNEEKHITRCIRSLAGHCSSVLVVDCGSSDNTVQLAKALGADILVNPWINYSTQMNCGIDALAGKGGWLLRIDADEILDPESAPLLSNTLSEAALDVDALLVQRRIHFLGRRIRYGTIEPSWQLRIWRNGRGRCEDRWMDEHILVAGKAARTPLTISDINTNSLTWWTQKHNSYSCREAIDLLNLKYGILPVNALSKPSGPQARLRRKLKEDVYGRVPSGIRAFLYFIYRYVFRLGFLDGREGFYFHVLQGFWYRMLVDAKIFEIERHMKNNGATVEEAISDRFGITLKL